MKKYVFIILLFLNTHMIFSNSDYKRIPLDANLNVPTNPIEKIEGLIINFCEAIETGRNPEPYEQALIKLLQELRIQGVTGLNGLDDIQKTFYYTNFEKHWAAYHSFPNTLKRNIKENPEQAIAIIIGLAIGYYQRNSSTTIIGISNGYQHQQGTKKTYSFEQNTLPLIASTSGAIAWISKIYFSSNTPCPLINLSQSKKTYSSEPKETHSSNHILEILVLGVGATGIYWYLSGNNQFTNNQSNRNNYHSTGLPWSN